jgi:hypothetical protein
MKLIDLKTGKEVKIGDTVTDFRGDKAELTGIYPPRHSNSSGRVTVWDGKMTGEYFPSVFGCQIVEEQDTRPYELPHES